MPEERAGLEVWLNGRDAGLLAYRNTESETFFVIEDEGEVIGCGGFYIDTATANANLTWGMIHPTKQRQGFGRLLLQYRLQKIKELTPGRVITMDTSQHTAPFYLAAGFELEQIVKNGYGEGLDRYDMHI